MSSSNATTATRPASAAEPDRQAGHTDRPGQGRRRYLGDISVTIDADDRLEFPAQRLLDLLPNVVDPDILRTLQRAFGTATLRSSDFEASGININYDPQELALQLTSPAERRATQAVQVSPMDRARSALSPSPPSSAAISTSAAISIIVSDGFDKGLSSPVFYLDGATRLGPVVLEADSLVGQRRREP